MATRVGFCREERWVGEGRDGEERWVAAPGNATHPGRLVRIRGQESLGKKTIHGGLGRFGSLLG